MDLIKVEDFLGKYPNIFNIKNMSSLNPYSDDFYQAIYSKKEFNELKLESNEPVPTKKGSLFKRQKIITRFLSSYTPYNSLLLFHSMGSGKCLHPDTKLNIFSNKNSNQFTTHKISELWDKYYSGNVTINDDGFWMKPKENIRILCMTNKDNIIPGEIINLYKEKVNTQLIRINLDGGITITKTKNHAMYTLNGWLKDISPGMYIRYIPDDILYVDTIYWKKVISIEYIFYSGFVYDLEVKTYHTYIANNLVTHNTCSAFGTTEKIREEDDIREHNGESRNFKGVIVITRKVLIRNLINELLFRCSKDNTYIPDNYNELTEREKIHRINKRVGKYYSFHTFFTFAKSIKEKTTKHIKNLYSNYIVIIDEVHNIRKKEEGMGDVDIKFTYEQIHRFLHTIENTKILLMSGTPMKDTPEEISLIMNLILPINLQMPTGKNFIEKFLENNDKEIPILKENNKNELKKYFRGRISYFLSETVSKDFISNSLFPNSSIFGIKTFTLYFQLMSDFQTEGYISAYKSDSNGNYYINSREAALFVFPDGTYGENGFKTLKKESHARNKKGISITKISYVLSNDIQRILVGSIENKLEKLRNFSDKYYFIVKSLLENRGRNSFIYCSFVKGSGIILLSLILRHFGFIDSKGNDDTKASRFAILTKDTTTDKQTIDILNLFNSDKNYRGKYIQTIIGSRVAGEGLSLKNIQDIYILTPHWNYSETTQAIYRGIREGSHRALIENYIVPDIKIYQMVSKPNVHDGFSIDEYMYIISAKKDISIKSIERVIKESSFDCQLTKGVNMNSNNEDYSRECNYLPCEYKCDGITSINPIIDYSTYNLYYNSNMIKSLKIGINEIYKNKFNQNLENLRIVKEKMNDDNGKNDLFITLLTLNEIINFPLYITDKYGFKSYLKERDNNYFLVNGITNEADKYLDFYSKNPINKICKNFMDILDNLQIEKIVEIIPEIIKHPNNTENILKNISLDVQEIFLEICFLMKKRGINNNKILVDKILNLYGKFISKVESTYISSLLYDTEKKYRCLADISNDWIDCPEEIIEKRKAIRSKEEENKVETSKWDYIGLHKSPKDAGFWIRNIAAEKITRNKAKEEGKIFKASARQAGKQCKTWPIRDLIKVILHIGNIPHEKFESFKNIYSNASKEDVLKIIKSKVKSKELLDMGIISETDDKDKLVIALFWINEGGVINICNKLRKWFTDNNLMEIKMDGKSRTPH